MTNWFRNWLSAFIWPCVSHNVNILVRKIIEAQQDEFKQSMQKHMIESNDYAREIYKNSMKNTEIWERQAKAIEKLVEKHG